MREIFIQTRIHSLRVRIIRIPQLTFITILKISGIAAALVLYVAQDSKDAVENSPSTESESKLDWKQQKEELARQRKRENDLKKTEERIMELESQDQEIDKLLTQEEVYTNVARCMELQEEKNTITASLEELYEKWEALAQ